jgi:hypothetical protein
MSGRGFSFVETLMAMALVLIVIALVFGLLNPAHGAFASEPETADMQQRVRTAADTLFRDLLAAVPPLFPHRRGLVRPDAPETFRSDTITITLRPASSAIPVTRTYYLNPGSGLSPPQLMRYNGASSDVPVVDHVVSVGFSYYEESAAGLSPIDPAEFVDGPWVPDALDLDRYDEDLLRVRMVRATLRVEAAAASLRGPSAVLFARPGTARGTRVLKDHVVVFDAAPRQTALESGSVE